MVVSVLYFIFVTGIDLGGIKTSGKRKLIEEFDNLLTANHMPLGKAYNT